jgi:hypothetical protein
MLHPHGASLDMPLIFSKNNLLREQKLSDSSGKNRNGGKYAEYAEADWVSFMGKENKLKSPFRKGGP